MTANATVQEIASREYPYGFVTDLEADTAPRGLNEDVIRMISAKKRCETPRHESSTKRPPRRLARTSSSTAARGAFAKRTRSR